MDTVLRPLVVWGKHFPSLDNTSLGLADLPAEQLLSSSVIWIVIALVAVVLYALAIVWDKATPRSTLIGGAIMAHISAVVAFLAVGSRMHEEVMLAHSSLPRVLIVIAALCGLLSIISIGLAVFYDPKEENNTV